MIDLDDLGALSRQDSLGVLAAVEAFEQQCREGWDLGMRARLPEIEPGSVLFLGMGGSGAAGDFVSAASFTNARLPFQVLKGYPPLPPWVGPSTLVLSVSYSGNTEETLQSAEEALDRKAKVVGVSCGGKLAQLLEARGGINVSVPSGLQPRAALGYLALPLMALLHRLGVLEVARSELEEAFSVLGRQTQELNRESPEKGNPAKQLARELRGAVPVVYGGQGIGATAAYRFKCDLNEYAKMPAFSAALPELDHNEIVGWNRLGPLTREHFRLILLRDPKDHPRVMRRFAITTALIGDQVAGTSEVWARGSSPLARLLSLVFFGQMTAIYAAFLGDVDPGPVPVIEELKQELAKEPSASSPE